MKSFNADIWFRLFCQLRAGADYVNECGVAKLRFSPSWLGHHFGRVYIQSGFTRFEGGYMTQADDPKLPVRQRVFLHLHPSKWPGQKPSPVTHIILGMILFSLVLFTFETEPAVANTMGVALNVLNLLVAALFGVEYGLRVWCCVEDEHYSGWRGRLKFALTPMALVDLLAFLPTFLVLGQGSTHWLRLVRVLRILRVLKLGRYSTSLRIVVNSIRKGWRELVVTFTASMFFLYFSAVVLYFVESGAQPEAFGSIPRAVWWAVATLTTVGYGDVYPITALGKLCAGVIALIGVAIVALPAGILAGGFIEEFRARREQENREKK